MSSDMIPYLIAAVGLFVSVLMVFGVPALAIIAVNDFKRQERRCERPGVTPRPGSLAAPTPRRRTGSPLPPVQRSRNAPHIDESALSRPNPRPTRTLARFRSRKAAARRAHRATLSPLRSHRAPHSLRAPLAPARATTRVSD